jgi:hypothetical protein
MHIGSATPQLSTRVHEDAPYIAGVNNLAHVFARKVA